MNEERTATVVLCLLVLSAAGISAASAQDVSAARKVVRQGIAVEFQTEPEAALLEGTDAEVRFKITDATTGTAVTGLRPAAWMDLRAGDSAGGAADCKSKIQGFLNASLSARPTIDLNVYYVLTLNDDASISVVDPLFGFGGSKLLTTVLLKNPGHDWALSKDGKRLFVSMPLGNQVAVVDTTAWKVAANIGGGSRPMRLALQPDEKYLWVAYEEVSAGDTASGVVVIDAAELKVAARIPTGLGHHEIAFTPDDRYAFVTNKADGTLSVIDVRALRKVADVKTGRLPVSLAFSEASQAVYVAHEGDGGIAVVSGRSHEILARIQAKPGLRALRFAPGGRWGLVTNWEQNTLEVFDSSANRIVQTAPVGKHPDQIAFSGTSVHVRSNGEATVHMIALNQLGQPGSLPNLDYPGGQTAPEAGLNPALADSIAATPEGNAVLVANALDKTIYYYSEGMAAPMGSFKNYGRIPRAVQVVDRSMRERSPGVYSSSVKLSGSGNYDLALLLDSPRVTHCFEVAVKPNPGLDKKGQVALAIEPLLKNRKIPVGRRFRLEFRVTDPLTHAPRAGLKDVGTMILLAPGTWRQRDWGRPTGDGVYEVELAVPKPGTYYVFFQCPSLGARYHELPSLILEAAREDAASAAADTHKGDK